LMKGSAGKDNSGAAALAGSAAVTAMINLQPIGVTGVNSDGAQPVSVNVTKNDAVSLLDTKQIPNAKPETTPEISPKITPDTNNRMPQTGSVKVAKNDAASLLDTKQIPNAKPERTPEITPDTKNRTQTSLEQAFVKLIPEVGTQKLSAPETKIPEINASAIQTDKTITPEMMTGKTITSEIMTAAMKALNVKTPDSNPQEINLADSNSARHSKHDLSTKDTSDILKEVSSNSKPSDNKLLEIHLADSNGSQLSKHDLPAKDTPDALKEISSKSNDSKQDEGVNNTALTVDKNQQAFHEVVGKAAHTEGTTTSDAGDKLVIGAAKTIELNGNKFTIMRKGDTSIEVKLEPDGIGKLDIRVNVEKGVLSANISASDASAKGIIEKNLHEIVNALTKEGLTVGGFTVSLRDRGGNYKEGKNENSTSKNLKEERQIRPIPVTGYVKAGYNINDGISIFA
ncbi:MAG: flagellar hook-length control protein FliK, partial [Nitrospirae bacterium]|nr:flagellar hook-length control protein FliK [Nitrospirota bacterium]